MAEPPTGHQRLEGSVRSPPAGGAVLTRNWHPSRTLPRRGPAAADSDEGTPG